MASAGGVLLAGAVHDRWVSATVAPLPPGRFSLDAAAGVIESTTPNSTTAVTSVGRAIVAIVAASDVA